MNCEYLHIGKHVHVIPRDLGPQRSALQISCNAMAKRLLDALNSGEKGGEVRKHTAFSQTCDWYI